MEDRVSFLKGSARVVKFALIRYVGNVEYLQGGE